MKYYLKYNSTLKLFTKFRGLEKIPALYSTIAAFFSTISFILASLFMIGIIYNKQTVYSTGCGFLAFLERIYILNE